jgi:hypothetical protein
MARTTDPQKEQFWKAHIAQAKYFQGSISKYCRSHDLQVHTFKYWKHRLTKRTPESRLPVPSSFIPVKVSPAEQAVFKKNLPDPKWLAEIIFELHARFQ